MLGIAINTVEPAGQPSFLYNCMQTRLMDQYKGKWPISLVCVSKPMITEITAIDVRKKIANKIRNEGDKNKTIK